MSGLSVNCKKLNYYHLLLNNFSFCYLFTYKNALLHTKLPRLSFIANMDFRSGILVMLLWKVDSYDCNHFFTCMTSILDLASSISVLFFRLTAAALTSQAFLMSSSLPMFVLEMSSCSVEHSSSKAFSLVSVTES